jgi:hypothetical protein
MLATGRYLAGAVVLAASVVAIVTILRGRNPWWIRGPLDYWEARRKQSDSN